MNKERISSKACGKEARKILIKSTGPISKIMYGQGSHIQGDKYRAPSRQFTEYLNQWHFNVMNKRVVSCTETHMNMCPPYGKFAIPQQEMERFFTLYEDELKRGSTLGIVEKPLAHMELPLVIDVDLKYPVDDDFDPSDIINLRKHNFQSIKQVLGIYKKIYEEHFHFRSPLDREKSFWVVTQRKSPYLTTREGKECIKDGWHVVNPMIRAFPSIHHKMREKVLEDEKIHRIFASLGSMEPTEKILDADVIGKNGWLLYGSTKPERDPYELAYIFDQDLRERTSADLEATSLSRYLSYWRVTTNHAIPNHGLVEEVSNKEKYHPETSEDNVDDVDPDAPPIPSESKDLPALRGSDKKEKKKKKKKSRNAISATIEIIEATDPENAEGGAIEKTKILIDLLGEMRAKTKTLWLEIGTCLKGFIKKMCEEETYFEIWVSFSEKFGHFDREDCENAWADLDVSNAPNMTTLKFWASKDSPKEWQSFKRNEIRQFLTLSLNSTHVDVVKTLHLMYESRYVCSSVKNNSWYEFKKNRWHEIEGGVSLRKKISSDLAKEYSRFRRFCLQMADYKESGELPEELEYDVSEEVLDELEMDTELWLEYVEICESIIPKLKNKGYKDQIMAEAKEKFYDPQFEEKLNERHELIAFDNFIVDLNKRVAREGRPDDYITFSTKTNYVPNYQLTKEYKDIITFLKQIYLSDEMVHYALKERAHMLHGDNTEERIFCWIGVGGNGKSKFRELNAKALGDYVLGFPVTLFTGKRAQSNSASPEVARSKGKRMAFIDEPEENQRLNMGLAKQLSGGDTVQARMLYGNIMEFTPQFGLTFLCNDPPKVPPHDIGTQRRITCDPHNARFVKNPTKPNEFERDQHLSSKIYRWRHVFASMLIDYYYIYEDEGLNPPEQVTKFTNQFLKECDMYDEFISDVLVEIDVDTEDVDEKTPYVSLNIIYSHFKAWVEINGISQRRVMSFRDFKKYISKKITRSGLLRENKLYGYREKETSDMGSRPSY